MIKKIFLVLMLLSCDIVFAEYSTNDLLELTLQSLSYDIQSDTAYVKGVGKITQDNPIGIFLARRAALTDAQRGLLILRRKIQEGKPPRMDSVSGNVPPFEILSESMKDGLYFVEVETNLSELLSEKNRVNKFQKFLR